jgi:hypothetical protein
MTKIWLCLEIKFISHVFVFQRFDNAHLLVFVNAPGPIVDDEEKHKVLLCKKIQDYYNLCTSKLGFSKSTHSRSMSKGVETIDWWCTVANEGTTYRLIL